MADNEEFDFDLDFPEAPNTEPDVPAPVLSTPEPAHHVTTVAKNDDKNSVNLNRLVDMTKQHMDDDQKVRDEINELTGVLDNVMPQMTIKELLEYLKIKIKEREFHVKCIYDAYNFVQRMEFAKEMLVGDNRKERVMESLDNQRLTKIMGYLNLHNKQD